MIFPSSGTLHPTSLKKSGKNLACLIISHKKILFESLTILLILTSWNQWAGSRSFIIFITFIIFSCIEATESGEILWWTSLQRAWYINRRQWTYSVHCTRKYVIRFHFRELISIRVYFVAQAEAPLESKSDSFDVVNIPSAINSSSDCSDKFPTKFDLSAPKLRLQNSSHV